ncbi:MAG: divergent polysaccharide deacetylase family protein [Proteobacteria bacterium]|nr:divergent polysaccharide deacetylase family protein [Pseudomonadota bacterium]
MCANETDDKRAGSNRSAFLAALESLRGMPVGVWIALALILGVLIGVFAGRQFPSRSPAPLKIQQANATTYEEYRAGELENRIKLVDSALFRSQRSVKPEADRLQVQAVEGRESTGREYLYQTIRMPLTSAEKTEFVRHLTKELGILVPSAKLSQSAPNQLDISIDGLATHHLLLPGEAEKPAKPERPQTAGKGRLALIIDDMGEDVGFAQGLAALNVPVAFSIWPDSGNREAVLKIAKAHGREILIHLPMQPKGYPKVDPGKHALLVTMTADEIQSTVRRAVERVPGAIGLNNHMGSQFTENPFGMHVALQTIKDKGLFFLDSRTTAESVGEREAKRVGLRFYKRDVFLDNEQNVSAVLLQLRKAEALARSSGRAIAIGHPHHETLQAIRQWLKEKDDSVSVVALTALPVR